MYAFQHKSTFIPAKPVHFHTGARGRLAVRNATASARVYRRRVVGVVWNWAGGARQRPGMISRCLVSRHS
jgi:hypothetical protein